MVMGGTEDDPFDMLFKSTLLGLKFVKIIKVNIPIM